MEQIFSTLQRALRRLDARGHHAGSIAHLGRHQRQPSPDRQTRIGRSKKPKMPVFKTGLRPDQWVGLLETVYASDGSLVTMDKVEPSTWAGTKAVRFEFSMTRKNDDLNFRGVGWATEQDQHFFQPSSQRLACTFTSSCCPKLNRSSRQPASSLNVQDHCALSAPDMMATTASALWPEDGKSVEPLALLLHRPCEVLSRIGLSSGL
jgi:hypothetical protein